MIKNLLQLADTPKLEGLEKTPFIQTGGNNHCASMGVECKTTSEDLLALVKPWIETEIKTCQKSSAKNIVSGAAKIFQNGQLDLNIPGYKGLKVQALLEAHEASSQGLGYVKVKNLRVCSTASQTVRVRDLKILVDGKEDEYAKLQEAAFGPCREELQTSTLLYAPAQTPITKESLIQFSFNNIELSSSAKTNSFCQFQSYYDKIVVPQMETSCLGCHQQNMAPLTCERLTDIYNVSGHKNWSYYFQSGQRHPKLRISQGKALLENYLKLETQQENDFILPRLARGFKKLWDIYVEKKSDKLTSVDVEIMAATYSTCIFNKDTHKAICWGDNDYGQLGYGDNYFKLFKEVDPLPLNNIKQLVVGNMHTCALLNDGTAKCWGENEYGQLGYGVTGSHKLLKEVGFLPLNKIKQLVVGDNHTCALLNDGTAKCWGENINGELGYGYASRYEYKKVELLPLNNIKQLVAGDSRTCALFNGGTAKCWGDNLKGQLGYGETGSHKLLKEVGPLPLNNIKQLVVGDNHTCALFNDDSTKCWGNNNYGQLGYNDTQTRNKPDDEPIPYFPLLDFF